MPASPPEGTRDARLPPEDDVEPPPPSSGAHRRPTMELGADVYARETTPGVYPALARERAIREAKAGPPPLRVPASVRPPPASVRPPPASERPRAARLTEPLAAAYPPLRPVLPFEPSARSPSSPSTSFGPISAMTLQARTSPSFPERALTSPPRPSRLRVPAAGLVLALGVAALVALLARRSAAPAPTIETATAAPEAPAVVATTTAPESPPATGSEPAAVPTPAASVRSPGWKPPSKSSPPIEVAAPPSPAPSTSSRARHRLFDTEN